MRKLDKFKCKKAIMVKAMRIRVLACEQVPEDLLDEVGDMMRACHLNAKLYLRKIEDAKFGDDLDAIWDSWVQTDQFIRTVSNEEAQEQAGAGDAAPRQVDQDA